MEGPKNVSVSEYANFRDLLESGGFLSVFESD